MRRARTRCPCDARGDQRERGDLRGPQRAIGRVVGEEAALARRAGRALRTARRRPRRAGARASPAAGGRRVARASRTSTSTANAADHANATSSPARPRSCTACGSRAHEQAVGGAVEAALLERVEENGRAGAEHAAGCRRRPRRAGRLAGRLSESLAVSQRGVREQRRPGGVEDEPGAEGGAGRRAVPLADQPRDAGGREQHAKRGGRPGRRRRPRRAAARRRPRRSARAPSPRRASRPARRGRWRPSRQPPRARPSRRPRGTPRRDRPRSRARPLQSIGSTASTRVPPPARALDAQPPAERLDAVRETAQAGAAPRVRATDAVVGDATRQLVLRRGRPRCAPATRAAYLATFASASEQTKYATSSCAGAKRPSGTSTSDRHARLPRPAPPAPGGGRRR